MSLNHQQTGMVWLYLSSAIGSEVTGTLSLRGALDHSWLYALVIVGFLSAFGFLTQVLRRGMSIGVAYGIWGAVGVALTAILSMVFFSEPVTPLMMLGIALIIGGVLCIEFGTPRPQQPDTEPA